MRHTYTPGASSQQAFKNAINSNLGVYNFNQRGNGIGGFLKRMLQQVVPIGKSILKAGIEAGTPHAQKFVADTIERGSKTAIKRISAPIKKPSKKVNYGPLS